MHKSSFRIGKEIYDGWHKWGYSAMPHMSNKQGICFHEITSILAPASTCIYACSSMQNAKWNFMRCPGERDNSKEFLFRAWMFRKKGKFCCKKKPVGHKSQTKKTFRILYFSAIFSFLFLRRLLLFILLYQRMFIKLNNNVLKWIRF